MSERVTYRVTTRCTFCGECLVTCPWKAITMDSNGAQINQPLCRHCGKCYENCASHAIDRIYHAERKKA